MSTIRKQSIISSGIVYFGFALGALNIYFFARGFEPAHFGLTTLFVSIGNIMYAFANVGMEAYIYKFYPYYKDNLRPKENDMMSWVLLMSIAGFALVVIGGLAGKQWVIRNFGENSADLVKYYYWILPFGFGLTLYSLLEAYSLHLNKTIYITFLREVLFRVFTMILIAASITGLLKSFDLFIKIYSFTYLLLAAILLVSLARAGELHFPFTPSRVTRKFIRKIRTMVAITWGAKLVFNISTFFALVVIAWVVPKGLESAAVYAIAAYAGSVMQAPQRTLISASIGPLSRAWKDKDMGRIDRIYQRSSINQLIFSVGIFVLIWMNFTDGILSFHLNATYLNGLHIFLFVGLTRIVDMGTGVNSQIIGTSNYWRFELLSGLVLMMLTLPMNYWLARKYGAIGPAIADLFTFSVYNGMRWAFLKWKFGLQPFTLKSIYTLALGLAGYFICYLLFRNDQGLGWIVVRSVLFCAIYAGGMLGLKLSEDILPVWRTVKERLARTGRHSRRDK